MYENKGWIKTFELDNIDVLAIRQNNDEDGESVKITFKLDGMTVEGTIGFEGKKDADKMFTKLNKRKIQKFVCNLTDQLN
jgi:hypothetical protein